MARPGSPTRFNGYYDDDPISQNINYAQDINEQMRVPKRIKATGEYFDEHEALSNNGAMNSWNYHEKLDMTVPDRIVVMGQDQHLGENFYNVYAICVKIYNHQQFLVRYKNNYYVTNNIFYNKTLIHIYQPTK